MTPLVGADERTSDVALTFRWLLALRQLWQLLLLQLLQLPALLRLQHWMLVLRLSVDMTAVEQNKRNSGGGEEIIQKDGEKEDKIRHSRRRL